MKRFLASLTALTLTLSIAGCDGEGFLDSPGPDYISIVQNGYLGEYTDVAVKDLLSRYYISIIGYDEETWDGGTTDSGKEIVEVKYQDNDGNWDDTTIQFTMLDEQCFQVTALVDQSLANPVNVKTAADLSAELNYFYFMQYALHHEEIVGDFDAELDFIQRLGQISGSAVLYGASADYSGNRGELYKLTDDSPLELTVPWLLDFYGLLDMSYYAADSDLNEPIDDSPIDNPSADNSPVSDTPVDNPPVYNPPKSDTIIETQYYTLTIPASWDGKYICEQQDNDLTFYELRSYNDGSGGMLFALSLQEDQEFLDFPGFYSLGALIEALVDGEGNNHNSFLYYVVVSTPTDVQYSENGAEAYSEMSSDIDAILSSITTKDNYAIIE